MAKVSEASLKNLKPCRTTEEARERGRKGGKASAEARRAKKRMQDEASMILNLAIKKGGLDDFEFLGDLVKTDENGEPLVNSDGKTLKKNFTVQTMALMQQARKAVEGDAQALAFLRDTAGEKPVEQVEVSGDVTAALSDLDAMIAKVKSEGASGDGG